MTLSSQELKFWHPADVTSKLFKRGNFYFARVDYLCMTFDENGFCYTGTDIGKILVWNSVPKVEK